jgi:hypothetical protein
MTSNPPGKSKRKAQHDLGDNESSLKAGRTSYKAVSSQARYERWAAQVQPPHVRHWTTGRPSIHLNPSAVRRALVKVDDEGFSDDDAGTGALATSTSLPELSIPRCQTLANQPR